MKLSSKKIFLIVLILMAALFAGYCTRYYYLRKSERLLLMDDISLGRVKRTFLAEDQIACVTDDSFNVYFYYPLSWLEIKYINYMDVENEQ